MSPDRYSGNISRLDAQNSPESTGPAPSHMETGTGTDYEGFKVPSSIPQDILLIQDLVGPVIPPIKPVTSLETDSDDSIDSSGESTDSVEEVEANLISVDRKSRRSVAYPGNLSLQLLTLC